MRVVSEVEYWWERVEDHCMLNWKSLTIHQHNILYSLTFLEPRKNMWLVTSYLSYRLNLYTTGVPNICWQQEYIYTRAGEDTGGFGDRILGKKVGDQCIFTLLLMQNPSKRLPSFCQQKSKGFQTQFLQVTLRLVSWRQETVPQVTC